MRRVRQYISRSERGTCPSTRCSGFPIQVAFKTMVQIAKKVSVFCTVLGVSWLGIVVGQEVTRHAFNMTAAAASTGQQDRYENLELFQKVLHFVESNYVEEIKNKDLIHGAIKGMLETLDPHSNFLPP